MTPATRAPFAVRGFAFAVRGLAVAAFVLTLATPRSAGADDPGTATPHPYGSVDRRDDGDLHGRMRAVLERLPAADRERAVRRLRAMQPGERRRFFGGFQGLSQEEKRARLLGWVGQGRRQAVHEERQEQLRDLRGNLRDLSPREQRALRRQVHKMTPEQQVGLRERMKNLEPGEQRELARRIGRWRRLDDDEKQDVRERLDRYRDRPADQRDAVRRNTERWRNKTPAERQALREKWEQWQSLTPAERNTVRRGVESQRR